MIHDKSVKSSPERKEDHKSLRKKEKIKMEETQTSIRKIKNEFNIRGRTSKRLSVD